MSEIPGIPGTLLDEATEVGNRTREDEPRSWSAQYGAVAEHIWPKAYAAGLLAAAMRGTTQSAALRIAAQHQALATVVPASTNGQASETTRQHRHRAAGHELRTFVDKLQQEHDLTDTELMNLLAAAMSSVSKYQLRGEWYPDGDDTPDSEDEASPA